MGVRACLPPGPSPAQTIAQRTLVLLPSSRSVFSGCDLVFRYRRRTLDVGVLAIDGLASSAPEGLRALPTLERGADTSVHLPEGALTTEDDDDRVVTTFRWPAALGGQDVSVVGTIDAMAPKRHI